MELREHKSSFYVYAVLRILVILCMVRQIINRNYENVFLCILTLILLVMPSLLQLKLKVELPTVLEIIILLFIFFKYMHFISIVGSENRRKHTGRPATYYKNLTHLHVPIFS
mgnify:CR=1 FL=1